MITKALSIRQPWVWAIFDPVLYKDIENRDWRTSFCGLAAIHASKGMTKNEYRDGMDFIQRLALARNQMIIGPEPEQLVKGAIIGVVRIVECVAHHRSRWFTGEFGFVLGTRWLFRNPIPCKGGLGFWEIPQIIRPQFDVEYRQAAQLVAV